MSYPLPLKTVALIGRQDSLEVADSIVALCQFFQSHGVAVLVETETAIETGRVLGAATLHACECADFPRIGEAVDVAIVVGGDGTLLHAARQLARYDIPLVGINQGRLGFMTDIARSGMLEAMTLLMAGEFTPEARLLLDTEVVFGGASANWQPLANLAFNDVVIDKGATGRMIEFELRVDDEFIYSARADGLIICTPHRLDGVCPVGERTNFAPQVGGYCTRATVSTCPLESADYAAGFRPHRGAPGTRCQCARPL